MHAARETARSSVVARSLRNTVVATAATVGPKKPTHSRCAATATSTATFRPSNAGHVGEPGDTMIAAATASAPSPTAHATAPVRYRRWPSPNATGNGSSVSGARGGSSTADASDSPPSPSPMAFSAHRRAPVMPPTRAARDATIGTDSAVTSALTWALPTTTVAVTSLPSTLHTATPDGPLLCNGPTCGRRNRCVTFGAVGSPTVALINAVGAEKFAPSLL